MKAHPALTETHEAWRDTVRRFVEREILPQAAAWDEAGEFPRALYKKAAAAGLLGMQLFDRVRGGVQRRTFKCFVLPVHTRWAQSAIKFIVWD